MSVLPDEIWRSIMEIGIETKSLDYKNLCCLSIVCRRFRRLAGEDSLWSHLLLSDFPSSKGDLGSAENDRRPGAIYTSSSTSNGEFKSIYRIRYEKDREKNRLAHRRAVLLIESQIGEHTRRIRELKYLLSVEKENMGKLVAELQNLRRIREASVAVNVWQPEIIRSRQREMVEQNSVQVGCRIDSLVMEFNLCKQQIAGFNKAIRALKKRRSAAEKELASVEYHPLRNSGDDRGQLSECQIKSRKVETFLKARGLSDMDVQ